jgi:two-component system LytT family response regulator
MRVLIVDDEPAARRRLSIMLEELDVEVVGEAANGVEALDLAARMRPDVVLLDIAMREVSGLDVARLLPAPRPLIIFQTAHDEYAIQAFEHDALDYVLKPVTLARLRLALERATQRLAAAARPELTPELFERLRAAVSPGGSQTPARLLLRDGDAHRLVSVREIVRFSAADDLVWAHVVTTVAAAGGSMKAAMLRCDYSLTELESRFGKRFVRVSRADLVNVEHVRRLAPAGDESGLLTLVDGSSVRVSRRRMGEVLDTLER